jgi:3-hydroxyacyl-[acyl-carrier-protein] dehydratase
MTNEATDKTIDISGILKLLPHRYPFLLIDRLINVSGEESGTAIKNVTMNEPFFPGHFPGAPVMPGVLIVEAMAQAAGAIVLANLPESEAGKLVYFMSIDKARFRKPVLPGDQLYIHVKLQQKRPPVWKYWAEAHVDGKKVAEAEIGAMLMDKRGV